MTAFVDSARPFDPPFHHREYSNDIDISQEPSNIYKRLTLVALPFLSLYKPLGLPISLGMGVTRVYTFANQLISDIPSRNCKKICLDAFQTTIAVIALASTIFAHPLGMIVTTSQDIIFELSHLVQFLQKRDLEASLVSLTKIINNTLYLALICRGGLELSIASLAMQAITLVISSRDEFKKGHVLEGYGNLLMAAVRVNQGYSQFKLLQAQWELKKREEKIKQFKKKIVAEATLVAQRSEKGHFPKIKVLVDTTYRIAEVQHILGAFSNQIAYHLIIFENGGCIRLTTPFYFLPHDEIRFTSAIAREGKCNLSFELVRNGISYSLKGLTSSEIGWTNKGLASIDISEKTPQLQGDVSHRILSTTREMSYSPGRYINNDGYVYWDEAYAFGRFKVLFEDGSQLNLSINFDSQVNNLNQYGGLEQIANSFTLLPGDEISITSLRSDRVYGLEIKLEIIRENKVMYDLLGYTNDKISWTQLKS